MLPSDKQVKKSSLRKIQQTTRNDLDFATRLTFMKIKNVMCTKLHICFYALAFCSTFESAIMNTFSNLPYSEWARVYIFNVVFRYTGLCKITCYV